MSNIIVIGGGATGSGIARLAAERGHRVTLIERGDLGSGTSGRFHGVLHSGARYAVADPAVAADCYRENQRLRRLMPSAITDTGGMFVALNDKEAAHADIILAACHAAGIPCTEISRAEALKREPNLNSAVTRALLVPDGFIDGTELIRLNRLVAEQAATPATFFSDHEVVGFDQSGGRITAVQVRQAGDTSITRINCDYIINAGGVWAPRIAELAGQHIPMVFDKGTMIIYDRKFTSAVINRCRPEDDGDLLVSHADYSIMGTTSRVVHDPEDFSPTQEETDVLAREGALLVPALATATARRIYAGIRPLQAAALTGDARSISRSFNVIDHDQGNFISVVGGKVTLHRLMAEAALKHLAG